MLYIYKLNQNDKTSSLIPCHLFDQDNSFQEMFTNRKMLANSHVCITRLENLSLCVMSELVVILSGKQVNGAYL